MLCWGRIGLLTALSMALGGCITTGEIPLAKNLWQVQVETQNVLFTGQADSAAMRRAAELTLAQGYDRFIVRDPQTVTGVDHQSQPFKNVSLTIVMFHAGEPQAAQAIDAADYLKHLQS